MGLKILNLFYEEPDPDRWLKFDRYPRKVIRRLIRGKPKPGGVMMVAIQLMRGLEKLNIPFRFNDYGYITKNPKEIACIIGKPHLLEKFNWKNPIIFGAGVFSHPIDHLDLLSRIPSIKKIIVPGPWMKEMFIPYYGPDRVDYWPVGIDSELWSENVKNKVTATDFLIYDKIRWKHDEFEADLIRPIAEQLIKAGYNFETIRYGSYSHPELIDKLSRCKAVIFLCEHESQGLAYQQILSTNTPILAWDRGGFWEDPSYFPHRVKYEPVTSVPYWDDRCGVKFRDATEFAKALQLFIKKLKSKEFSPRTFVLQELTLEKCSLDYYHIHERVLNEL